MRLQTANPISVLSGGRAPITLVGAQTPARILNGIRGRPWPLREHLNRQDQISIRSGPPDTLECPTPVPALEREATFGTLVYGQLGFPVYGVVVADVRDGRIQVVIHPSFRRHDEARMVQFDALNAESIADNSGCFRFTMHAQHDVVRLHRDGQTSGSCPVTAFQNRDLNASVQRLNLPRLKGWLHDPSFLLSHAENETGRLLNVLLARQQILERRNQLSLERDAHCIRRNDKGVISQVQAGEQRRG